MLLRTLENNPLFIGSKSLQRPRKDHSSVHLIGTDHRNRRRTDMGVRILICPENYVYAAFPHWEAVLLTQNKWNDFKIKATHLFSPSAIGLGPPFVSVLFCSVVASVVHFMLFLFAFTFVLFPWFFAFLPGVLPLPIDELSTDRCRLRLRLFRQLVWLDLAAVCTDVTRSSKSAPNSLNTSVWLASTSIRYDWIRFDYIYMCWTWLVLTWGICGL